MKVEVVDVFGSDAKVSKMARISFGHLDVKRQDELPEFLGRLLEQRHLVPFEHCALTFFVECPVFVARQLLRYRTAAVSERSLRYCQPMDAVIPDGPQAKMIHDCYEEAWCYYDLLLKSGLPKEAARCVLPLGSMTQFYFTMNLRNLMHLFDQRLTGHAQRETRQVAFEMFRLARKYFPITFGLYRSSMFGSCDEADE